MPSRSLQTPRRKTKRAKCPDWKGRTSSPLQVMDLRGNNSTTGLEQQYSLAKAAFDEGDYAKAFALSGDITQQAISLCRVFDSDANKSPKYAIVILSNSHSRELDRLIGSVKKYETDPSFELIFVNNGNDRLFGRLSAKLKRYTYIEPGFDAGCSVGRNIGVHFSTSKYAIFLDDDGIIPEDTVDHLVSVAERYDAVAVRGRVLPKGRSGEVANHYDRGEVCVPCTPTTEGVSIWRLREYVDFGGFDPLLSGHEGLLLCGRMLPFYGPEAFLYSPRAILYHDYSPSSESSDRKKELLEKNERYIAAVHLDTTVVREAFEGYSTGASRLYKFISAPWPQFIESSVPNVPVSVITTARNGLAYVEEYSRSLLLQTHQNFEVIFVDDGSSDGMATDLRQRWASDDRMRIIQSAGIGRPAALNVAIEAARNDICVIADMHDVSLWRRLAWTLRYFDLHPESGCVAFDDFSDDPPSDPAGPYVSGLSSLKARSFFGMPASFSGFAFRKSEFVQPFDETLSAAADCDWLHRNLLDGAADGHFVPMIATYHRDNPEHVPGGNDDARGATTIQSAVLTHEALVGPLNDDDRDCVAVLTGWKRAKGHSRRLRRYAMRLAEAATRQFDRSEELISLIQQRLSAVELRVARERAKDAEAMTRENNNITRENNLVTARGVSATAEARSTELGMLLNHESSNMIEQRDWLRTELNAARQETVDAYRKMQAKAEEYGIERAALESSLAAARERNNHVEEQLKQAEKAFADRKKLRGELSEAEKRIAASEDERAALAKQLDAAQQAHAAEAEGLRATLAQANERLAKSDEAHAAQVESLQATVGDLENRLGTSETERAAVARALETAERAHAVEADELRAALAEAERAHAAQAESLQAEVAEAHKRLATAEDERAALAASLAEAEANTAEAADLRRALAEVNGRLAGAESDRTTVTEKLESVKRARDEDIDKLQHVEGRFSDLVAAMFTLGDRPEAEPGHGFAEPPEPIKDWPGGDNGDGAAHAETPVSPAGSGPLAHLEPTSFLAGPEPVFFKADVPPQHSLRIGGYALSKDKNDTRKLTVLVRCRDADGAVIAPTAGGSKVFPDCTYYKVPLHWWEPFELSLAVPPEASHAEVGFVVMKGDDKSVSIQLTAVDPLPSGPFDAPPPGSSPSTTAKDSSAGTRNGYGKATSAKASKTATMTLQHAGAAIDEPDQAKREASPDLTLNSAPSAKKGYLAKTPVGTDPAAVPKPDIEALRADYERKGLHLVPDTFVLFRVVGNDLPPRHRKGQGLENLRFILENEPELANCEKRWVVNRIVDQEVEEQVIEVLEQYGQSYVRIPFVADEYAKRDWKLEGFPKPGYLYSKEYRELNFSEDSLRVQDETYHYKNLYVMNNNGARNVALRAGREAAKWVLPWDGNCFVTPSAWQAITQAVTKQPYLKYFAVPMVRVLDNGELLLDNFVPEATEEPQLLFRQDASEEFNENVRYGRRPKVQLFYRLGIPGKWDRWKLDPWEAKTWSLSPEAGQFADAGWVARLFSGSRELELATQDSFKNRGRIRVSGIKTLIDAIDEGLARRTFHSDKLLSLDEARLEQQREAWRQGEATVKPVFEHLQSAARQALRRGPYSVVQKSTLAPSGDIHDYWHPGPYWWPNPETADGLPYVKKDGQRVPGTQMYEPDSDKYDRTRLQRMFDDTTSLALAWFATGDNEFAAHGARLVRTWFLEPKTRMNPHMTYSQVRLGRLKNQGPGSGTIEMKDLYYFLDATRLLHRSGALTDADRQGLAAWVRSYLSWLQESPQGTSECEQLNNHGSLYDLQVAAIAGYLDDLRTVLDTLKRSKQRILQQFEPDGRQPFEMDRPITQHYCAFNLQSWANLATFAQSCGIDLWHYTSSDGRSLKSALEWTLRHMGGPWPYEQTEPFDEDRYLPLYRAYVSAYGEPPAVAMEPVPDAWTVKPVFFPHDGIRPYWMLGA